MNKPAPKIKKPVSKRKKKTIENKLRKHIELLQQQLNAARIIANTNTADAEAYRKNQEVYRQWQTQKQEFERARVVAEEERKRSAVRNQFLDEMAEFAERFDCECKIISLHSDGSGRFEAADSTFSFNSLSALRLLLRQDDWDLVVECLDDVEVQL